MNNSLRALPLDDVMQIVDRRRRRRSKARAAAGSAAAVAGLGAAGIVGVYVSGDRFEASPAAPSVLAPTFESTSAAVTTDPSIPPTGSSPDAVATAPPSGAAEVSGDEVYALAFSRAGYSNDDAVALAARWELAGDAYAAKVEAGRSLVDGVALADGPRADPSFDDPYTETYLREYFYGDGYTPSDAITLAEEWGTSPEDAALRAGSELKVVGAVPFVDRSAPEPGTSSAAFFEAGCTVADARLLAEVWGLGGSDEAISEAKVRASDRLVAGEPLPATTPPLSCG